METFNFLGYKRVREDDPNPNKALLFDHVSSPLNSKTSGFPQFTSLQHSPLKKQKLHQLSPVLNIPSPDKMNSLPPPPSQTPQQQQQQQQNEGQVALCQSMDSVNTLPGEEEVRFPDYFLCICTPCTLYSFFFLFFEKKKKKNPALEKSPSIQCKHYKCQSFYSENEKRCRKIILKPYITKKTPVNLSTLAPRVVNRNHKGC